MRYTSSLSRYGSVKDAYRETADIPLTGSHTLVARLPAALTPGAAGPISFTHHTKGSRTLVWLEFGTGAVSVED